MENSTIFFFFFFLKPYTIISLILIDFLTIFIIFNLFQRIFRGSKSPKLTLRGEVNPFQKDPKFKKVPTPLGERVVSTLNEVFGKLPLAWMFVLSKDYIFWFLNEIHLRNLLFHQSFLSKQHFFKSRLSRGLSQKPIIGINPCWQLCSVLPWIAEFQVSYNLLDC